MIDLGILGHGRPWHEHADARVMAITPRWKVVVDWPYSSEARKYGLQDLTPWRINAWTPWGWLGIALTPGSRFVSSWRADLKRYVNRTFWVQWAPR